MKRTVLIFAVFIIPTIAGAGDIYKCTGKDGKVEYSSRPCEVGKVEAGKIQTVPTSSREQAQANADLLYYRGELQRREALDRAYVEERARSAQGDALERDAQESAKREQQLQNEKQLVHTDQGWERMTRAQLAAYEKRKAAEAKAATAQANAAAGPAIVNAQQHVFLNGRPMVPAAGGFIDPQSGTFYIDVAGGAINSQTGQFVPK